MAAIDRRGLGAEGIYSVVADEEEARALREHFFDGSRRPNMMTVANIHVVAGCLLSFLRELDEPLLTLPLYGRFLSASEEPAHDPALFERLGIRLLALPAINFFVTMTVVQHLKRVLSHTAQNKMTLESLCTLFVPAFLASPLGAEADETDHAMQMRVMELLVLMEDAMWDRLFQEVLNRGPVLFVHSPDPPEKLVKKATPKKEEMPC